MHIKSNIYGVINHNCGYVNKTIFDTILCAVFALGICISIGKGISIFITINDLV